MRRSSSVQRFFPEAFLILSDNNINTINDIAFLNLYIGRAVGQNGSAFKHKAYTY